MTENYDNWERLMRAVLRRESDKQIALSRSSDTSTVSSTSSSFRATQISRIPMDYSDLTLDHVEWSAMLPPNKQQVTWRSASLSFFLDPKTEKNCFLLGASKLIISSVDEISCFSKHPKSRFSEVSELTQQPSEFWIIEGRIKKRSLSPGTLYEAYLVFGFTDKCENVGITISAIRVSCTKPDHYLKVQHFVVRFQPGGNERADGWMETRLGEFYIDGLGSNGDVIVTLHGPNGWMQTTLIVEGIEFRPSEGKKNREG